MILINVKTSENVANEQSFCCNKLAITTTLSKGSFCICKKTNKMNVYFYTSSGMYIYSGKEITMIE